MAYTKAEFADGGTLCDVDDDERAVEVEHEENGFNESKGGGGAEESVVEKHAVFVVAALV